MSLIKSFKLVIFIATSYAYLSCEDKKKSTSESISEQITPVQERHASSKIDDISNLSVCGSNNYVDSLKCAFGEKLPIFFDLFPDNFQKFRMIFGFEEEEIGILYDESNEYIDLFFELGTLSDKLFNLALDGYWEADAVGYYQEKLILYIISNPSHFTNYLSTINDKKRLSIFIFLLDGAHVDDVEKQANRMKILKILDNKNRILLDRAYQTVKNRSEH